MATRFKPKNEFGKEVDAFRADTGIPIKKLAELAGVKYSTLIDTTTGRSAGHEIIPKVRQFMTEYAAQNQ